MATQVPSALEIARSARLKPVTDIAETMGLSREWLELYGDHTAKIKLGAIQHLAARPRAKYVVMTGITPTPLGEGKTTTTIGLGQAFARIGKRATIAIPGVDGADVRHQGRRRGRRIQPSRPVRNRQPASHG